MDIDDKQPLHNQVELCAIEINCFINSLWWLRLALLRRRIANLCMAVHHKLHSMNETRCAEWVFHEPYLTYGATLLNNSHTAKKYEWIKIVWSLTSCQSLAESHSHHPICHLSQKKPLIFSQLLKRKSSAAHDQVSGRFKLLHRFCGYRLNSFVAFYAT